MNEFDLDFGAQVFCKDGKCGTLSRLAVDPETWQVTHLIVEEGFLLKRARVFPFASLDSTTPAGIYLTIHSTELENYPVYQEETVETPAPNQGEAGMSAFWREGVPYGVGSTVPLAIITEKIRHGVPEDVVVTDRGTPVEGLDGGIGKLDHFLVGATAGELTQIIIQQGLLFINKRAIPAYLARSISEDGIFVEASREELEDLPEYLPDGDDDHDVDADDVSEGNSPDRAVAGNPLADLSSRVAEALFEDSRTSDEVIEVIDERGMITLDGEVDSAATRDAAQEIAAAQRGVTAVVNLLRVRT